MTAKADRKSYFSLSRIASIFPDAVLLNSEFNFISVSHKVLETIGYSKGELDGLSVSQIANSYDLQRILVDKLAADGGFENEQLEIHSKNGNGILFSVSGFRVDHNEEANGVIVLRFNNLDEINLMYDNQVEKSSEIDRFVYRAAHELRGPVATIKGLMNLTRVSKEEEAKFLLDQVDIFIEKLDDKLHKLMYFAESGREEEAQDGEIQLAAMCERLDATIQEVSFGDPIHFECSSKSKSMVLKHGKSVLSLLRNVILFFAHQPKTSKNTIKLDVHACSQATEIVVRANGFQLSEKVTRQLKEISFGYTEILSNPELFNCYAAKKIIVRLRGQIQFIQTHGEEVVVIMTIPQQ